MFMRHHNTRLIFNVVIMSIFSIPLTADSGDAPMLDDGEFSTVPCDHWTGALATVGTEPLWRQQASCRLAEWRLSTSAAEWVG